jgi:UDP:flavonoid glycosyltransferase YjiC (YdhE family)
MRSSQRQLNRALRRAGAARSPVFLTDWPRLADGVVQLTVEDFEYPRGDLPPTVEFVGPIPAGAHNASGALSVLDADRAFEPPAWWSDVLAADTVVHVTQGTFDNAELDHLITPTLRALGDRDDVLVVVTTGRPVDQFHGNVPANARVTEWLPYSMLMPHVDVMITNGGYGGVQHALSHGVPVIVAGETSDKAEVAARVAYAGVGIDLRTAMPTSAELGRAVERVLGDDAYRTAARRMKYAIDASTPIDAIANVLKRVSDAGRSRRG